MQFRRLPRRWYLHRKKVPRYRVAQDKIAGKAFVIVNELPLSGSRIQQAGGLKNKRQPLFIGGKCALGFG